MAHVCSSVDMKPLSLAGLLGEETWPGLRSPPEVVSTAQLRLLIWTVLCGQGIPHRYLFKSWILGTQETPRWSNIYWMTCWGYAETTTPPSTEYPS